MTGSTIGIWYQNRQMLRSDERLGVTQGAEVFTPMKPVTFDGWRSIMMNATGPPQSWATSFTVSTPKWLRTAAKSSAISALV